MLGPEAVGHKQAEHEYLYWEHQKDIAVRSGNWKAIQVGGPQKPWELYDLANDVSEEHNVAAEHSDILEKLKGFAAAAHAPVEPGVVYDRTSSRKIANTRDGEPEQKKPAAQEEGKQSQGLAPAPTRSSKMRKTAPSDAPISPTLLSHVHVVGTLSDRDR